MSKSQLDGWNEKETIEYYSNNRIKYQDLYDSEKYFLNEEFLSNVKTILDVGCSVGGMFNIFKNLNESITYDGLDVSENAISKAKKLFPDKSAKFYLYDGYSKFPLKNKYDLVFSSGVMHLIDNYKEIFQQMIARTNKYLLVDFRITSQDSYAGKLYFSFLDKKHATNFTNYHVVNFKSLMDFFKKFNNISKVIIFGYKGKGTDMSEGIDEVYMLFFKIEINDSVNSKFNIIFENRDLENLYNKACSL